MKYTTEKIKEIIDIMNKKGLGSDFILYNKCIDNYIEYHNVSEDEAVAAVTAIWQPVKNSKELARIYHKLGMEVE